MPDKIPAKMDGNNNNRLHLNFGNERLPMPNDRTYPTTPSTFPQPVFPPSAAGQQAATMQQQAAYGAAGYAPQGYFSQGQYQQQQQPPLPQQPQYPAQPAGYDYNGVPAPGAAQYQQQPRSNTPGSDPNTGLAHQFSHQNLGGAARQAPYAPRAGAQAQRPRTAGGSSQQPAYTSYANVPLPTQGGPAPAEFQSVPERNPDKFGSNANSNQKKCSQLAADFFKDSVKRARERNQRYVTMVTAWRDGELTVAQTE